MRCKQNQDCIYDAVEGNFFDPDYASNCANFKRFYKGLKKAYGVGIFVLIKWLNKIDFIKKSEDACVYKKISGSIIFLKQLSVHDTLLIGNDILDKNRDLIEIVFQ